MGFSGWDERKLSVTGTESLKLLAGLWFRCVHEFRMWPWRLVSAFDDNEPVHVRLQVLRDFLKCDSDHLEPGFAAPLRDVVPGTAVDIHSN
eukprot:565210-Pyramimonas_sp.AAC.1